MNRTLTALAAATALTLALGPQVQAQTTGQPPAPQTDLSQRVAASLAGVERVYRDETIATLIPREEHVLSVTPIQLLASADIVSCFQNGLFRELADDCFEARTEDGDVLVFTTTYRGRANPYIEGHIHDGAELITVEHVRTANYVTCRSGTPDGCTYDRFVLIED